MTIFSKPVLFRFCNERPLVWILLDNRHSPLPTPIQYPALVDTGATRTLIPHSLCRNLGHVFEKGSSQSVTSGIGGGVVRTFGHAIRITILTASCNESPVFDQIAFEPFELQASFVEQHLPFILFGQRDFLKLFRYIQHGQNEWFSLEPIH